jgi:hypothetical protein
MTQYGTMSERRQIKAVGSFYQPDLERYLDITLISFTPCIPVDYFAYI